ncbi:MAG TPA: queuosine salvage family protein [Nostocaceae cyanobacterium]|nr:queuosine salvage family protein [Nostocaceae cyanobacterium]
MILNIFTQIRAACQQVASTAKYVKIDSDRLSSYTSLLPLTEAKSPQYDTVHHFLGNENQTLAYIITLDTINFGSGYFPYLRKRPNHSGYFTVAVSLKDRFEKYGAFSAEELTQLTTQDCAEIFNQDLTIEPVQELMNLFASALNDLGKYLLTEFQGDFINLIQAANSSAEKLVEILSKIPYFRDVQKYNNLEVPFYKRAQITAADLALAFNHQGFGYFHDLQNLTIFADNLVPHVLRVDGILQYDESLAARIDAEELIVSGSIEEIEIRAAAVYVVELLVAEFQKQGHHVTASGLDYLLWNRGQQPHYKAIPRHRARTVFY